MREKAGVEKAGRGCLDAVGCEMGRGFVLGKKSVTVVLRKEDGEGRGEWEVRVEGMGGVWRVGGSGRAWR